MENVVDPPMKKTSGKTHVQHPLGPNAAHQADSLSRLMT